MKIEALPDFISEPYKQLMKKDLDIESQIDSILEIYENLIFFIGKLSILEYVQSSWQAKEINFWIFNNIEETISMLNWIKIAKKILNYFASKGLIPNFSPLINFRERYSFFKEEEKEDKIKKLLWFYDSCKHCKFAISIQDVQEAKENLNSFLIDFNFFEDVRYEVRENQTFLIYRGYDISLFPFYIAKHRGSQGLSIVNNEINNEIILNFYQKWFPGEFEKFKNESSGIIDFENLIPNYSNKYIKIPWLEKELDEFLENAFNNIRDLNLRNIMFIEGYPACGKTSTVINLKNINKNFADEIIHYFALTNHITDNYSTLENWIIKKTLEIFNLKESDTIVLSDFLRFFLNYKEKLKKICIVIDNVGNLDKNSIKKLLELTTLHPFNQMLFLFVKRCNEKPYIKAKTFTLKCSDNINFDNSFSINYIRDLFETYIKDETRFKIFSYIVEKDDYVSLIEISNSVDIFTPEVEKHLEEMKPLFEVKKVKINEDIFMEHFKPFNQICKKFVDLFEDFLHE